MAFAHKSAREPNTDALWRADIVAGPDPRKSEIVNCENCSGLCCSAGSAIPLTDREARLLTAAGTLMHRMSNVENMGNRAGRNRDFYLLEENCSNLDANTGECAIYEERPQACREFVLGGFACQQTRAGAGLPIDLGMPQLRPE